MHVVENWQSETERYKVRVAQLPEPLQKLQAELQAIPSAPLDFRPSDFGLIHYQACLLALGGCRAATELVSSFESIWGSGRFLSASLVVRLLVEISGASVYANRQVVHKLKRTNDIAAARAKITKLLHGSRSGVPLPFGGVSKEKPVHVMDFIREADMVYPGTMDSYEFLCDACHPSFLQNTYLMFAGVEQDNWSNKQFARYGHDLLDRTLSAAERAVSSLQESGIAIVRTSLPLVLSDRGKNPDCEVPVQ